MVKAILLGTLTFAVILVGVTIAFNVVGLGAYALIGSVAAYIAAGYVAGRTAREEPISAAIGVGAVTAAILVAIRFLLPIGSAGMPNLTINIGIVIAALVFCAAGGAFANQVKP